MAPITSRWLDIHILQTTPNARMNLNDTREVKTCQIGNSSRIRVSSQALKYAALQQMRGAAPDLDWGLQTDRIPSRIVDEVLRAEPRYPELAEAAKLPPNAMRAVADMLGQVKIRVDVNKGNTAAVSRWSKEEVTGLANLLVTAARNPGTTVTKAEVHEMIQSHPPLSAVLWGRFFPGNGDLSLEAVTQTAHAFGVETYTYDSDFFTAIDELADHTVGFLGETSFGSSTLYRYATIDLRRLGAALGELSARVLPIYLRAWLTSLPLGGTNGFAVHTLPDAVWIAEREPQPVSFANAYSAPVRTNSITEIIDQFATYAERVHRFYNATPTQAWTLCPHPDTKLDTLGKRVTLDQLLADTADLALPVRT